MQFKEYFQRMLNDVTVMVILSCLLQWRQAHLARWSNHNRNQTRKLWYVFSLHQRRRVVRPADLPSSLLTQLDGSTVVVTDRPRLRSTFAFQPFLFLLVHLLPLFSSFISASFAYKFQGSILGSVSSANDCRWSVHFVSFVPGRD